jgi:WD40 repeat protein
MGLAVSKDGKMFAAAGYGGTLRVYDMESGNMLFNLDRDYWVTFAVAFAPDGTALITAHDKGFKAGANVARITPLAK